MSRRVCEQMGLGLACGVTDVGLVRQANEDSFLIDPELSLVAIADGMGGHADGAMASNMALLAMRDFIRASSDSHVVHGGDATIRHAAATTAGAGALPRSAGAQAAEVGNILPAAIAFANRQIHAHNLACHLAEGAGMGTTLTGFWQSHAGAPLTLFHVGDTRLVCHRAGQLLGLTTDQTHYQRAIDAGATQDLPPPNLLLQALGPFADVSADLRLHAIEPGDIYLLSSDGLHGSVPPALIAAILRGATMATVGQACDELIALAKAHGSRDNITAVVLACH